MKNKYCDLKSLRNESDVEQHFIIKLLNDLGFTDTHIYTKKSIPAEQIGKGNKRHKHIPDYGIKIGKNWLLIIEAKHPDLNIKNYVTEAQEYSAAMNRNYVGYNPIKYCLITNGKNTAIYPIDENKPILTIKFDDFKNTNSKFKKLKTIISHTSLKNINKIPESGFEFRKPTISELKALFNTCHNLIWKKQAIGPKKAFYEFTKLLFVKMNEDKKIKKIRDIRTLKKSDFRFSVEFIENSGFDNPINNLFEEYRNQLEIQVQRGKKKRIFGKTEELNLNPNTIKNVVAIIQNIDLHGVEEDINGKVFETFLEASVRGKELGQFFTPRPVVKFITQMAELKIRYNPDTETYTPDKIIDPCCGTGGFLIFALSDLFKKLNKLPITDIEDLKDTIKEKSIYGIDKSEDDIVQATRMNMYLHGDGGSHIFMADSLNKQNQIEDGFSQERVDELNELEKILKKSDFDVILSNPPFSMKYEKDKPEEKSILEQYTISYRNGTMKSSLKSNVMFLERANSLLKKGGKLITVIDESVLNIRDNKDIRKFLRNNYIIKCIISLPMNTFVNQDAGVKTSIIYCEKRKRNSKQPKVFMSLVENIGHSSSGKPETEKNQLPKLYEDYKYFQQNGELPENSNAFLIDLPDNKEIRLDCEFYNPIYKKLIANMKSIKDSKKFIVEPITEVCVKNGIFLGKNPSANKNEFEIGQDMNGCKYIKIEQMIDRYIDWDGCANITVNFAENNKNKVLQKGDILTPSRGDTIGKVDIVVDDDKLAIAYANIHILRPDTEKIIPEYLVYYLRSDIGQMQFNHFITGSLNPPQLIQDDMKKFIIAYPESIEKQKEIVSKILKEEKDAFSYEQKFKNSLKKRNEIFDSEIF